jgi:hypothetical protein
MGGLSASCFGEARPAPLTRNSPLYHQQEDIQGTAEQAKLSQVTQG